MKTTRTNVGFELGTESVNTNEEIDTYLVLYIKELDMKIQFNSADVAELKQFIENNFQRKK